MIAVWFSSGAASAVATFLSVQKYAATETVRVINNPVAEEAEAKLAQSEKQEPVAWRWRPKGGSVWFYDPKIEWLDEQDVALIDKEPVYAAPVASDAELRVAPEDPTDIMIEAALQVDFDNEDERATVINIWHVMVAALNPSEPRG